MSTPVIPFREDKIRKWDQRFLDLADFMRSWSKDPSTQVGCVIVTGDRRIVSTGYNGLPRMVSDDQHARPERHDRELEKYSWYEHAERNALYNAANIGVSLKDCTVYITMAPCMDCARGLIQSGISRVVWRVEDSQSTKRWESNTLKAIDMMKEAGIITLGLHKYHPE